MKNLFIATLLVYVSSAYAQDYMGFVNSNYSGITGAILNPANIADSRLSVDVNIVGINLNMANNYIGIKREAIAGNNFRAAYRDSLFQQKYLVDINNGADKSVFFSKRVSGPGFMLSLGQKDAIGLSSSWRSFINIDGVGEPLARLMYTDIGRTQGYNIEDFLGKELKNKYFSANVMSWMEYGLTYAHVFRNQDEHFIKAGLTPKFLMGMGSAFMNVEDLEFQFDNNIQAPKNDTLQLLALVKSRANYAHSDNLDNLQIGGENADFSALRFMYPGFAIDMGVVYEWRPDYKNYKYDMDGKTGLWRRDKNKYKLRVGLSVLDWGHIKYKKGHYSQDFYVDVDTIRYRILDLSEKPVIGFDRIVDSLAVFQETPDNYNMSLPTAISLQVDYAIWKDFYVSFTPYFALLQKKRQAKLHDITVLTVAPRWDWKWLGVSVPVSYNSFYAKARQPIKAGLMLRLGPIILGTNDLASYTAGNLFGANFYTMLKVPIPYGHIKDKDKDGVSNKKDQCRDVPGTWEFLGCPDRDNDHIADADDKCPDQPGIAAFGGCPDTDGDGVQDSEDACPEIAGIIKFNGCPDTDGDNIIDREDDCPTVPGLAEFKGCPDRDGDGIEDKEDECPDFFGPREFKGCPDKDADNIIDKLDDCPDLAGPVENNGCPWPDADQDGIPDREDDCPQVAGVPELKGCPKQTIASAPTTQTVEMKAAEKKIIEKAFATLEFATGKDIIKPASFPALNDLAKLLISHSEDWKIKLNGHTDNQGDPQKNMDLSEKRVNAVKNYLVKKGVNPEQVVTEWFGQTQPIADNKTPKGRQKNRRVEMKIMAKE